jgi:hypothetical protein
VEVNVSRTKVRAVVSRGSRAGARASFPAPDRKPLNRMPGAAAHSCTFVHLAAGFSLAAQDAALAGMRHDTHQNSVSADAIETSRRSSG